MAANYDGLLPTQSEAIVDARGIITRKFRDFLAQVTDASNASLQAQIDVIAAELAELIAGGGADEATIEGLLSVATVGTLADGTVTITLVNDQQNPGNSYYYGTSAAGGKGWHVLPDPPPRILPLVTGEIAADQPVFVYADDGSLIYTEIE